MAKTSPDVPGYVRSMYMDGIQQIRQELRSYWLNHAFLEGYQWVWWSEDSRRLDIITAEADRIQPTFNRMRSNMRTITANLTQRPLAFENPASKYDDATIRSARIALSCVRDIAKAHDWEDDREKLMIATLKGGSAAWSVDWDEANKTTVEMVLPIGDFVVEPGTLRAETARWWVRKQALPPEEVEAIFPEVFTDGPPPADSNSSLDPYMHRITGDAIGGGEALIPRTFIFTLYERPNPLHPEGRIAVEVDGRIIQQGDWPFPWTDRLNFALTTETAVENQWQGSTVLDDCRPVQVALNAAWANLLEHLRDAGTARLIVPTSAVDLIRTISDLPGEIMEYPDGSTPPAYMSPAQLTSWLQEMPDKLAEFIDDMMGVHEVSRGQAPANIESGLGLSILKESDASPTGRLIQQTVKATSKVASMVAMLHEAQVKSSRETTVIEGSVAIVEKWKGSDMDGQTNVFVPLDAIVPRSRAAMVATADKMMQMKLITNIAQYAKIADLPGQEDLITAAAPDMAKARRENGAFVMKEVLIPAKFDDHEMHIEIHNEFRKTARYEQLEQRTRDDIDLHVQAHETLAAEQAGRAQMQAATSPGLAAAPNADGSQPMVDPEALPQPMEEPPPQAPEQMVDEEQMVMDMMASMNSPMQQ